jgi:hypothetical protein
MATFHKKASHLKQALQDYREKKLSSHASLPSKVSNHVSSGKAPIYTITPIEACKTQLQLAIYNLTKNKDQL